MKRNKHLGAVVNRSAATSIGIGVGGAVAVSALLSMGLSSLVINGAIQETTTSRYIFAIRALSVLIGGLLGAGIAKGKYLPVIGLTTLGYLIVLLGVGIAMYDGSFQNFGAGIVSVLAGGIIACILKLKPQRKSKRNARYIR